MAQAQTKSVHKFYPLHVRSLGCTSKKKYCIAFLRVLASLTTPIARKNDYILNFSAVDIYRLCALTYQKIHNERF